MSLQALNDAEGPAKELSQTVAPPSGDNLTAQQKQDVANYHTAMKQAQGELETAKALLGKATSLRDSSGSHCAGLIHSASDDSMKDSWWDSFKEWVSQHAWIIKDIGTVLEVVATVLAIVALQRFQQGTELTGVVNYAWPVEELETDLRVFTACGDLRRLQAAMPDIDELVRNISVEPR